MGKNRKKMHVLIPYMAGDYLFALQVHLQTVSLHNKAIIKNSNNNLDVGY